jgi:hypothetical protein
MQLVANLKNSKVLGHDKSAAALTFLQILCRNVKAAADLS